MNVALGKRIVFQNSPKKSTNLWATFVGKKICCQGNCKNCQIWSHCSLSLSRHTQTHTKAQWVYREVGTFICTHIHLSHLIGRRRSNYYLIVPHSLSFDSLLEIHQSQSHPFAISDPLSHMCVISCSVGTLVRTLTIGGQYHRITGVYFYWIGFEQTIKYFFVCSEAVESKPVTLETSKWQSCFSLPWVFSCISIKPAG